MAGMQWSYNGKTNAKTVAQPHSASAATLTSHCGTAQPVEHDPDGWQHKGWSSGKSTLAVQLAITWARDGRDVLLVDGDKQGSVQKFIAFRTEAERQPPVVCVQYTDGRVLRDQVRLQAPRYQDVVIDAGGHDSTTLRAALLLSHAVLVPFLPRTVDVLALGDMAALIEEARGVRDGLLAMAVLNIADPGVSSDNTDAIVAPRRLPATGWGEGYDHPTQGVSQRRRFRPVGR